MEDNGVRMVSGYDGRFTRCALFASVTTARLNLRAVGRQMLCPAIGVLSPKAQ